MFSLGILYFKVLFDLGITEAVNEINRDIKFISDVLEKGENGLILEEYKREVIPFNEVANIINSLSNNDYNYNIVPIFDEIAMIEEDDARKKGIFINKVLFKILLDNLLTNANKYGFKNKNKRNEVVIMFAPKEDRVNIIVKNNGKPFPKNFDRVKFITKYSTADNSNGSGLGGYDIDRIASYFENENWELKLNIDPMYPVVFEFSFPVKLL